MKILETVSEDIPVWEHMEMNRKIEYSVCTARASVVIDNEICICTNVEYVP